MRWFLDMCIPLYYIGEGDKPDLNRKTINFVNQKSEDRFVVCYQIKNHDLPRWIKRQNILIGEIIRKISNSSYSLASSPDSSILTARDKKKMLKLWASVMNIRNKKSTILLLSSVKIELQKRIDYFFLRFVDELVIPIEEIDIGLKSSFLNYLNLGENRRNDSDARTMSSAIQEHNREFLTVLTADKNDWSEEIFQWALPVGSTLSKKYPEIPTIRYIQDI